MPTITTQKQLRPLQNLNFCYLCGKSFSPDDKPNDDHVPPTSIFSKSDRTPPLILPTHAQCNSGMSDYDEQIGQLVSLLHRKPTPETVKKLNFKLKKVEGSDQPAGLLFDFPLRKIITRWLKGMHAALYHESLPAVTKGQIFGPLPQSETAASFDPIHHFHPQLVEVIKRSRLAKCTDNVICRNGKYRYECVWTKRPDDGLDSCVFAIDVYGWSQLGDVHHAKARSCVGFYIPPKPAPLNANRETAITFQFPNVNHFDAFNE